MKRKAAPTAPKPKAKRPKLNRQPTLLFQKNTLGLGTEKKNIDQTATLATTAAAVNWTLSAVLNATGQGTADNNRVGRKVTNKSWQMIWSAFLAPTTTQGCNIRICIIYDKQSNGANPGILDIFENDSFYSHKKLGNADRFTTICDFITDPLSPANNFCVSGKAYRKMGLDTVYQSAGGAIANIGSGALFLLVSQNGQAAVAAPSVLYNSRTRFIDP